MKKQIWKFPFKTTDRQTIKMPQGAVILSVQTQRGIPCLWAIVNPDAEKEERIFDILGTGHPMDEYVRRTFIGTYQNEQQNLVWHLFEILR